MRRAHGCAIFTSVMLGCGDASTDRDITQDTVADTASVAANNSSSPTWYQRGRALDLTGDEQPDSAHLAAAGARVDSLQVTLRLFVGGVEKHREEWGSSYELAFLDSARFQPAQFDSLLRAKLDTVLASIVVQRLDAPSVRLMAEDSAILAGLDPRPTHRISFSYGFETTVRLVWDAPRQQFVRLWSCC